MTGNPNAVLVADHDAHGRELLEGLLQPLGCQLYFADNGQEALDHAAAVSPDLVLLDARMPGLDGFEVCRRLRADAQLAEVPIIMLTAFDDRESRLRGLEAGADDFISKPFDREEFAARVKTILRLNRHRRLLAERAKFEKVIELAPDGILVVDAAGVIRLANPAAQQLLGAGGNSALPGRVFVELVTPARRAGLSGQFAGLFGNEAKILKLESELVRLDGETRPVELAARAFPWDHQPAVQIILRDLTEKKKFEEQFLRAQRLQSLGCLAGGIAHDLNNVLTPILAATDILGASAKDADDRRIIEVVDASARRGADIVKQILAFARGGKGEREPLQIRYVVGEIEKILTDALPRNIELQKSILPEAVLIEGDPTQLHQVLMNLCINARDAMPQGGQLKITATNIVLLENQARQIDGASPGAWLRLTVSDTGTGMTAEVLNRLFEPFFTTKAPGKGTGLGLATVQNIVKSHGGFLTVESIPGRGSHFHIHLPAASAPEVDVTAEMSPEILPQGRGELVLVADDEAAILEITKATLEFHGYRVLTARDGADAVALFCRHQHEIDLFLTDVNMPYLDGPGAIRAVETLNSRKQVRYVMMSGGPAGLNENELPAELPVRFLAKPFTAKALLGAFDESLHLAEAA